MARQINEAGLKELTSSEGVRLKAYQDGGGVWTIGWGHTKGVSRGQVITREQAEQFLREDLAWAQRAVETSVKVPLSDNQFAALVSFTFNVGEGAFKKSTLLKKLNKGDYNSVPKELMKWCNDNGKRVQGLYNRRMREGALFVHDSAASSYAQASSKNTAKRVGLVGQGTTGASVAIGTAVEQLSPFTEYSNVIRFVVVALVLVGIGLTAYGLVKRD